MPRDWLWKCPICPARGKKTQNHHKALHYGRWHMIQQHEGIGHPVLEKIEED